MNSKVIPVSRHKSEVDAKNWLPLTNQGKLICHGKPWKDFGKTKGTRRAKDRVNQT